ncbi:endosome-associated-trafficking regulator 1 [Thrips palmi]|uniref:Endosome-associated-trafficking regulator 1 n=1 Tax=Thrips palmi TaxID=161013 RepID=A0A6P8YZB6_THRPL|nr:endosome-associated-trafficking regulator 1 [Thrips palmi]
MSEGAGGDGNPLSNGSFSGAKSKRSVDSDDNDNDECANQPDLGLGSQPQTSKRTTNECQSGPSEAPRREENPFSFKHFLSRENANGQGAAHSTGAKPKVFTSPTVPHPPDLEYNRSAPTRNFATNPDLASALPDFVQDHLVVEQCFLRDAASSALSVDLDNLPDFAVTQDSASNTSGNSRSRQTSYNNYSRRRERNQHNGMEGIPLDLPSVSSPPSVVEMAGAAGGLPFDLPLVRDANGVNATGSSSPSGSPNQPSVSKSLPDFLSDGPIRGGHLPPADVTAEASGVSQNHVAEDMYQTENERLRAEVDVLRGQNTELSRRVHSLQSEVRTLRAKEHEDTVTMEKAIEQAEENIQRTVKRAVNAENMVSKLKADLKQMQSELRRAQQDYWELRGREGGSSSGACGGVGVSGSSTPSSSIEQQVQMQRFAQELKAAASTAETSLRQLLSGVDNLRLLASTMETVNRVEDRTRDYVSDSDEATGPTL